MQNMTALLLLGMLCSIYMSKASEAIDTTKGSCCPRFIDYKIPLNRLKEFAATPSRCPFRAIVFTTKANKKFCVNPSQDWVINHIEKIGSRSTPVMSSVMSSTTPVMPLMSSTKTA
ncbi:eotaxin-like [Osmerus mordax]|uniref:eotaxin-like n=1 Tax=Osmerus mordax TaxID=8014 RepID=UPI0035104228